MDQVTWNSNLCYTLVVVFIPSGHWILGLLGIISVSDLFDSWQNCSFKLADSRFIQIYSSVRIQDIIHFKKLIKHKMFNIPLQKAKINKYMKYIHIPSLEFLQNIQVSESWMSCSVPLTNTKSWSCQSCKITHNEKKSNHYASHMSSCIKKKEKPHFQLW